MASSLAMARAQETTQLSAKPQSSVDIQHVYKQDNYQRHHKKLKGPLRYWELLMLDPRGKYTPTLVTSTGSLTAPWCTYGGDGCEPFNSTYQQACAEGLCRAAGFASGTYVPGPLDPQDWCTPKLGSGWYLFGNGLTARCQPGVIDRGYAIVTAVCTGKATPQCGGPGLRMMTPHRRLLATPEIQPTMTKAPMASANATLAIGNGSSKQ